MRRYYDWKADVIRPHLGSRVLEVGCGTGLLLARLAPRERLAGVDRDSACVGRARARLGAAAEIETLDVLGEAFPRFAAGRFDTVVFCSSLEEIGDDAAALGRAAAAVGPGGRVVAFVSALPALCGELDRVFGQRRYRRAELETRFREAGLTDVFTRYVNLLGAAGWLWDSRIRRIRSVSREAYAARDRWVPAARALDALTGPPVGRSLLAVGTVPAAIE
jgi:SAM-dependent methyltransferase